MKSLLIHDDTNAVDEWPSRRGTLSVVVVVVGLIAVADCNAASPDGQPHRHRLPPRRWPVQRIPSSSTRLTTLTSTRWPQALVDHRYCKSRPRYRRGSRAAHWTRVTPRTQEVQTKTTHTELSFKQSKKTADRSDITAWHSNMYSRPLNLGPSQQCHATTRINLPVLCEPKKRHHSFLTLKTTSYAEHQYQYENNTHEKCRKSNINLNTAAINGAVIQNLS